MLWRFYQANLLREKIQQLIFSVQSLSVYSVHVNLELLYPQFKQFIGGEVLEKLDNTQLAYDSI